MCGEMGTARGPDKPSLANLIANRGTFNHPSSVLPGQVIHQREQNSISSSSTNIQLISLRFPAITTNSAKLLNPGLDSWSGALAWRRVGISAAPNGPASMLDSCVHSTAVVNLFLVEQHTRTRRDRAQRIANIQRLQSVVFPGIPRHPGRRACTMIDAKTSLDTNDAVNCARRFPFCSGTPGVRNSNPSHALARSIGALQFRLVLGHSESGIVLSTAPREGIGDGLLLPACRMKVHSLSVRLSKVYLTSV